LIRDPFSDIILPKDIEYFNCVIPNLDSSHLDPSLHPSRSEQLLRNLKKYKKLRYASLCVEAAPEELSRLHGWVIEEYAASYRANVVENRVTDLELRYDEWRYQVRGYGVVEDSFVQGV
jgi:hypothetical protein